MNLLRSNLTHRGRPCVVLLGPQVQQGRYIWARDVLIRYLDGGEPVIVEDDEIKGSGSDV